MASHSLMHHIFTHRIWVAAISAAAAIAVLSVGDCRTVPRELSMRGAVFLKRAAAMAICFAAGSILMLGVRDEYASMNGENVFDEITAEDSIEIGFVPSYSHVKNLSLKLEGEIFEDCKVELTDENGNTVEELIIPASACRQGDFYETEVNWKLKAGKQYELCTKLSSPVMIPRTEELSTLPEQNRVRIDGVDQSGHVLMKVTYFCQPVGPAAKLYYALTMFGVCLAAAACIRNLVFPGTDAASGAVAD